MSRFFISLNVQSLNFCTFQLTLNTVWSHPYFPIPSPPSSCSFKHACISSLIYSLLEYQIKWGIWLLLLLGGYLGGENSVGGFSPMRWRLPICNKFEVEKGSMYNSDQRLRYLGSLFV